MTIGDVERVVNLVGVLQPQIAATVNAVIGLAKWIGRRRQQGEVPPSDDAVLAAWKMAEAQLQAGKDSLDQAQAAIDARLNRLG